MPTKAQARKRGGLVRIRTKRLPDGTLLRIHVYRKPGPKGGKTTAEKVAPKKSTNKKGGK